MADREAILRTLVCDGIEVQVPEPNASIISRALERAAAATKTATDALVPAKADVTRLTTENATLTGQVAALTQKVKDATVTDAALDALVAARQALVAKAQKIMGDAWKPAGKTSDDIRYDVITQKLGAAVAATLKAAGDAAITGAYTAVISDTDDGAAGNQQLAHALSRPGFATGPQSDAEKAWEKRGKDMAEAWKGPQPAQQQ